MKGSEAVVMDALKMDRHLSHFSFSQALAFFAAFDPAPSLGLLTDFTHRIEHYATQELVDEWRNGMLLSQLSKSSDKPLVSNGPNGAEGGRWWNHVWDELANERDLTIRLKQSFEDKIDEEAAKRVVHYIPPIKLAWDGMVVPFSRTAASKDEL